MKHHLHSSIRLSIMILLVSISLRSFSQGETNNWLFGTNAGMDFNPGAPIPLLGSAMSTGEGCASISNSSGMLLFYSDGITVWNRNHVQMPNGFGLLGNWSSSQSAVIVPDPGNSNIYYLCTAAGFGGGPMCYSIVDMTLQGGFGDVTLKNQQLIPTCTERICAVKHVNQVDIWVIGQKYNTNQYHAFLVSPGSINTSPVISSIGPVLGIAGQSFLGYLKPSPDGTRVCNMLYGIGTFLLMDFDPATGLLSNLWTSPATYGENYGCEFSPDGTRLYVTEMSPASILWQLDLTQPTSAAVFASAVQLGSNGTFYHYGAVQIAPDGKCYVARNLTNTIGVINDPNALGVACNYVDNGFFLGGPSSNWGLPDFISSYFNPLLYIFFNTCFGDSTLFTLSDTAGVQSVNWDFDDPNSGSANTSSLFFPYHIFSDTGSYNVTVIYDLNGIVDTFTQIITINPPPVVNLGNDTTICAGASVTLDAGTSGANYLWSTTATTQSVTVTSTGTYSVVVTNTFGCSASDTINVTVNPNPLAPVLLSNSPVCAGDTLFLSAANVAGGTFSWAGPNGFSSADQNPFIANTTVANSGAYSATVTVNGCLSLPGITNVIVNPIPATPVIGTNSPICDGSTLNLTTNLVAGASYDWSGPAGFFSSLQNPSISGATFTNAGVYELTIEVLGCTSLPYQVIVVINPNPTSSFTVTPEVCEGDDAIVTYTGSASASGNYTWNFSGGIITSGAGQGPYFVNWPTANTYTITLQVTESGCTSPVTSNDIIVNPEPLVTFSAPVTNACDQLTVTFENTSSAGNYFWTFGDGGTSTDQFPTHIFGLGLFDVSLTVTTPEGCSETLVLTDYIKVIPTPAADFEVHPDFYVPIELDDASFLFTNYSSNATSWLWLFGDSTTSDEEHPLHQYTEPGMYEVTLFAYNEFGCYDSITKVFINVIPNYNVFIPTAFTPNGDGANDVFSVQGFGVGNIYIQVYDRWGEKIYEWRGLEGGWDGTFKGMPMNSGVYVYRGTVVMHGGKIQEVKGDVTLIR